MSKLVSNPSTCTGTIPVLLSLSKLLFYQSSVIFAGIQTTQHANGSVCNIQKYLPNQFTWIRCYSWEMPGNLQFHSLSHLNIPLPGWITHCLLTYQIMRQTAPCGSHVNSKQKSSHSKEPLIMQFFSNHLLSVTVSVTCLHILLQLEKQLLEKGCLCLKQQNVRHTPTCEEGSQNFCVPEIEFQKLSTTSRLTSDNLKVVLLRFPGLCKRCWSQ